MTKGKLFTLLKWAAVLALGVVCALTIYAKVRKKTPIEMARVREDSILEQVKSQLAAADRKGALATLVQCVTSDPAACRCIDQAMELGMDLGRFDDARAAAERSHYCQSARDLGGRAEVHAAIGRTDDALREADRVFAMDADEPYAWFARAWALSDKGEAHDALAAAEKAVKLGRGVPALILLGKLRGGAQDTAGALDAFDQAAKLAPNDARVAFDLGVVQQTAGHYRESREAYLHALSLDPGLADARYNLALLTHSIGASDEAHHHLDALVAMAPDDPRIPALRTALQTKK
jgi:tetratricopeptide (TPR) repeat protein